MRTRSVSPVLEYVHKTVAGSRSNAGYRVGTKTKSLS